MGGLLTDLERHAAAHFATEERLMQSIDYPETASHRMRRQDFARRVARFREKFQAGRAEVDHEVVRFLENWLVIHIQGADRDYAEYYRARRQRGETRVN